jgi:hypothetical protein
VDGAGPDGAVAVAVAAAAAADAVAKKDQPADTDAGGKRRAETVSEAWRDDEGRWYPRRQIETVKRREDRLVQIVKQETRRCNSWINLC